MNHIMTSIDESLTKGLQVLFAVAVGFVMWHNFWEWWQALLLVAGLIVVPFAFRHWLPVVAFWMIAAPLFLIFTYISIFWIVTEPDTTVAVSITSKEQDVRAGGQYGGSTTHYIIWAADDQGNRYKVTVSSSQWAKLSEGDITSITYHYERVAGRWFPRRVKTMLGQESVVSGGGRWGTPMEGFNTVMDMGASALPLAVLVGLYLKHRRKQRKELTGRKQSIEQVRRDEAAAQSARDEAVRRMKKRYGEDAEESKKKGR